MHEAPRASFGNNYHKPRNEEPMLDGLGCLRGFAIPLFPLFYTQNSLKKPASLAIT
jgi:hypothetical protein